MQLHIRHRSLYVAFDFLPRVCPCGAIVEPEDQFDHFHVCPKLAGARTIRHDKVSGSVAEVVQTAGSDNVAIEQHGAITKGDILAIFADDAFRIDTVITHPPAPAYRDRGAATQPLWAAKQKEKIKARSLRAPAAHIGACPQPFAIETLGGLGPKTKEFMQSLYKRVRDGPDADIAQSFPVYAAQKISVSLQKWNAFVVRRGALLMRYFEIAGKCPRWIRRSRREYA